jgi:hypothetical protein
MNVDHRAGRDVLADSKPPGAAPSVSPVIRSRRSCADTVHALCTTLTRAA